MQEPRWFFHPVFILVLSILALASSLFLYIYWYVEASESLKAVARRLDMDPGQLTRLSSWVVILTLSILVGIIFLGIFLFFVYLQKSRQQARFQRNFINNFTHELKTPVTSLKLYLETFSRHELPREDFRRYLSYMLADVERMGDNVNRILSLSRMESRTFKEPLSPGDPMEVVRDFVVKSAHLFPGLSVTFPPPEDGMNARCLLNRPMFEMMLMNFFSNAVKYSGGRPPELAVSLVPEGKKKVSLMFTDKGMGFAKRERKRVFGKFYQVGATEERPAMGTGLGLYMVKMIARMHRGKVRAHSPGPGMGVSFVVTLPRIREKAPEVDPAPAREGQ
ncbi:MAG: HAMP domain-containing histidine kinase [Proteobacteria bacterium]|nr:HAMP domain-containing histidine kinase [Pseudomonadota bacterium]